MTRHINDIEETGATQEATRDRIRREVIFVDTESHGDADTEDDAVTQSNEESAGRAATQKQEREEKPWMIFTTGSILTDGTLPYYRYFIVIAAMCFLSIFLTFMSLNADREYRRREKYASVLHERAVLKEEERYGLSSKSAVQKRLKEYGIELIDLSKESRLIERK